MFGRTEARRKIRKRKEDQSRRKCPTDFSDDTSNEYTIILTRAK
jgi:hypothetical protein